MPLNIDKYLEKAWKAELLDPLAIKVCCQKCTEILIEEDNVHHISAPISIVGDIHGQFYDVLEMFKVDGRPPQASYLFLGDYVDRGAHSVETMTLLVLLKIKYSKRVFMIRGNHETKATSQNYGFYAECQKKFGSTDVWEYFTSMFDFIPMTAVIDNYIFCVHGGLSPSVESLDDISALNRFEEIPAQGAFIDLMWSDPNPDAPGFLQSPRGAGYLFGIDIVNKFLHINGLEKIARAHQLCMEGYKLDFDDKLATVWSAPNYCYRFKNWASVLEVDEDLNFEFNLFSWAPESEALASGPEIAGPDRIENYFF